MNSMLLESQTFDVLTDSSWDDARPAVQPARDRASTRERGNSNGKAVSQYLQKQIQKMGEEGSQPGAQGKEEELIRPRECNISTTSIASSTFSWLLSIFLLWHRMKICTHVS